MILPNSEFASSFYLVLCTIKAKVCQREEAKIGRPLKISVFGSELDILMFPFLFQLFFT